MVQNKWLNLILCSSFLFLDAEVTTWPYHWSGRWRRRYGRLTDFFLILVECFTENFLQFPVPPFLYQPFRRSVMSQVCQLWQVMSIHDLVQYFRATREESFPEFHCPRRRHHQVTFLDDFIRFLFQQSEWNFNSQISFELVHKFPSTKQSCIHRTT